MREQSQIYGYVEIKDKNGKLLFENKNDILVYGKYKILSSLFSSKNEIIDGIKYLELYQSSADHLSNINNYNYLYKIKSIQINRRENISINQYDTETNTWVDYGNVLKKFKFSKNNYRGKFLLEKINTPINDFYTYMNLFNLDQQCLKYDRLQITFNIPLLKKYTEDSFSFNLLVMSYGGLDVNTDEFGDVLVSELNNEVLDISITNTKSIDTSIWTSGLPFSYISLPEMFTVEDQIYISWKYIFNFNSLIS